MRTGWVSNGGKWYYMDANGVMQTGWLQNGGSWYYLDGDGVMQTGSPERLTGYLIPSLRMAC